MVLQRREQVFSTPCERLCPHMFLNWGGPLWRPWNPLRFWRLVLGPSMDKIFARVVIRLAADQSAGLWKPGVPDTGRAGPAGVEIAGREHGSCNHAVGE